MTHPTARIVQLTPQFANELINRNPRNRTVSPKNLADLARAITRGEWELNGEAIKMAVDGYMLDGQHRCHAVIKTGVTITTFLIEGLPASTQDTMDQGKPRSLGNFLTMRGIKNATRVAACTTRVYAMQQFGLRTAFRGGTASSSTVRERLAWFDNNPWIEDVAAEARAIQSIAHYPGAAIVASLIVAFSAIDQEDSDYFWDRVRDGVGLPANHPVLVLRASLKRLADDTKGERKEYYIAAITIKAWNAYREGREIKVLNFRPGGARPEAFPEPK